MLSQSFTPPKIDKLFVAAQDQVGRTPVEVMEWLIRFAALNLGVLTLTEIEDLEFQATQFCYGEWEGRWLKGLQISPGMKFIFIKNKEDHSLHEVPRLFTQKELLTLQGHIRLLLSGLFESSIPVIPFPHPTLSLSAWKRSTPPKYVIFLEANLHSAFLLQAAQLIGACMGKFGKCQAPDCGKIFVFTRKTKLFCSKRCQRRIGIRELRKKWKSEKEKAKKRTQRGSTGQSKVTKGRKSYGKNKRSTKV